MNENRAAETPPPAASANLHAVTVCGLSAVLACFQKRPAALRRLWVEQRLARQLGDLLHFLAEKKLPYSIGTPEDVARAAGTRAHGGIAAATARPHPSKPKPSDFDAWRDAGCALLFADDVGDAPQIAAIARAAVAMGLRHLFLGGASLEAAFEERAWSDAAGALEELVLHDAGETALTLRALRERFCVVGFTRPGGRRVEDLKPIRVPGRPPAIVLGSAATGITPEVAGKCEHLLHIPGAGGNHWLNAGDTAAYGLPWLLRKERAAAGAGFLAAKRARRAGAKTAGNADGAGGAGGAGGTGGKS
ncbi:MAG: hypothetical protein LBR07_02970 [Puniceicoccales bacterium]|jgi:TrmH RNA methyltransferase|nr:hypothetical protein [Puniceicoccales bacterium]